MKGLLGRKIGMTQVYSNQGVSVPVSVVEIEPNVVTKVFTQAKDNYDAVQLGVFNIKKHLQKKPAIGHFKKAKTVPKRFVREIRDMKGLELGQKVDCSIFRAGELVDVVGVSKGKGFAGAVKRHNQSIGPKSHGGGGGSKPVRQTGSLGDISGNKVVKGMTMPGHMGAKKSTQQNLEIILVNKDENYVLVKGSIPGPKKGFVIVRSAVKMPGDKKPFEFVNLKVANEKNHLIEEAKKFGVSVNTEMTISEMKNLITQAKTEKEAAKTKEAEQQQEQRQQEHQTQADKQDQPKQQKPPEQLAKPEQKDPPEQPDKPEKQDPSLNQTKQGSDTKTHGDKPETTEPEDDSNKGDK